MKDTTFIYGEGWGSTISEADQRALADLTSNITVFVESDFEEEETEETKNGKIDSQSYVRSRVLTYSQITLNNTKRLVIASEPEAHVGRWIRKAEVDTLFKLRLMEAQDLTRSALRAEQQGKVDNALRYYYWAYLLTKSLRYPSKAKFKGPDGQVHLMKTWLPEQMRTVMDDVKCQVTGKNGNDISVAFSFRGKPVSSLDFTYFDGRDWCPVTSASDGVGTMEMTPGYAGETFNIRLEYEYRSEAHINRELEGVMKIVPSMAFPKAAKTIRLENKKSKIGNWNGKLVSTQTLISPDDKSFAQTEAADAKAPQDLSKADSYVATMKKVFAAINKHNYEEVNDCFTKEGLDVFQKLIHNGVARLVGTPQPVFHRSSEGVVCRGVQMSFRFKTGMRKSFVEEVVFTFNKSGIIKNIAFGLGQAAEQDILCKGVWPENVRTALMQFMENYKTAYALKRLDYLNTIFDDDAVIIVGNVARKSNAQTMRLETDPKRITQEVVRYSRYTKEQYMKNLARCFASNEFVNIRFSNNDVTKLRVPGEVYGIQIEQDYYSTTYGDHGYLFLIIDMTHTESPLIKVRTWQPERDPNFGIYGPGDFK